MPHALLCFIKYVLEVTLQEPINQLKNLPLPCILCIDVLTAIISCIQIIFCVNFHLFLIVFITCILLNHAFPSFSASESHYILHYLFKPMLELTLIYVLVYNHSFSGLHSNALFNKKMCM